VTAPEVRIVKDWHEALNSGDPDRLVELSHPDVGSVVRAAAGTAPGCCASG
jgi:hypothetical protein